MKSDKFLVQLANLEQAPDKNLSSDELGELWKKQKKENTV